jgi:hypothetical protein
MRARFLQWLVFLALVLQVVSCVVLGDTGMP